MYKFTDKPHITEYIDELITTTQEPGVVKQFIPDAKELDVKPYELLDPISDAANSPTKGLVHRYNDRVLLKVINTCPVYCRFCFRKDMLGQKEHKISKTDFVNCIEYISQNKQIWEVIFTGGDPLMLKPHQLIEYIKALSSIEHVKIIRFHTRVPVVAPDLITAEMLRSLTYTKPVYVAVHSNHPAEFTQQSSDAIAKLADSGIVLLSQSVLLKGVNDDLNTLEKLMRLFVENRIKPYYLHQLDLARGTSHFRVEQDAGIKLVTKLNNRLSGIAKVKYIWDPPEGTGKVVLA